MLTTISTEETESANYSNLVSGGGGTDYKIINKDTLINTINFRNAKKFKTVKETHKPF